MPNNNYYQKANTHFSNNELLQALQSIQKAIEIAPENAKYWELKGFIQSKLSEYENTLQAYSKAIELKPNNFNFIIGGEEIIAN